jgi:DNA-binding CsgD family transcriptional regulator
MRRLLPLVDQLDAAVGDDEALKVVCKTFGRTLGATMVAAHRYDYAAATGSVLVPIEGLLESGCAAYRDHFSGVNVWMLSARGMIRSGSITVSHLMCADAQLARSEWYNDFLRPHGVFHSLGCVLGVAGQVTRTVTFLRHRRLGNYTAEEQRRLQMLGPYFENAFHLHDLVCAAKASQQMSRSLLECFRAGTLLLGPKGMVRAMNRVAAELLAAHDGLEIAFGRLEATLAISSGTLRAALRLALGEVGGVGAAHAASAVVMRTSGRLPYQVTAMPLGQAGSCFGEDRAAAVAFVTDPVERAAAPSAGVAQAYHLTKQEAELAWLLVEGLTLREAADRMGVSNNTARTHLSHVFGKTGTGRQAELVRLLVLSNRAP